MEEGKPEDWIKLTSSKHAFLIEVLKGKLDASDIKAVVHNKQDSNYGFGELELHVRRNDFLKAKNIIDGDY